MAQGAASQTHGAQFTAAAFTDRLSEAEVQISMDGKGRALDNIVIERFWRSLKYEDIYLKDYQSVPALEKGLGAYIDFYNYQRPHQSLDYQTPAAVYFGTRIPDQHRLPESELNFAISWS
jgi:putative transposase